MNKLFTLSKVLRAHLPLYARMARCWLFPTKENPQTTLCGVINSSHQDGQHPLPMISARILT